MRDEDRRMKLERRKRNSTFNLQPSTLNLRARGFTLLEVLIALAITGGLMVTLIYSLNYHLGLVEKQETLTVATLLAKNKMSEMGKNPEAQKASFGAPHENYFYETSLKDTPYSGIAEIVVVVRSGNEEVTLNELVYK